MAGDVFEFRETNGHIRGQLAVSGDDMTGEIVENVTYRIEVRRIK